MGQSPDDLQSRIAALEAMIARTRHNVRSALAPAMLAGDMMRASTDPRVQRGGITVVRAIERVLSMLDTTRAEVPAQPDPAASPPPYARPPTAPLTTRPDAAVRPP